VVPLTVAGVESWDSCHSARNRYLKLSAVDGEQVRA